MRKTILAAAVLLAACSSRPLDDRVGLFGPDVDRAQLDLAIDAYNGHGIDPIQWSNDQLEKWDIVCLSLILIEPNDPYNAVDCAIVRKALDKRTAPVE